MQHKRHKSEIVSNNLSPDLVDIIEFGHETEPTDMYSNDFREINKNIVTVYRAHESKRRIVCAK